ncbi:MAG: response regulator transcription factor [Bacteroidota bacterium]
MHINVHTLQEYRQEIDSQLFLLEKKHKQGLFNLEDIADLLPVGLLINNKEGRNLYMNKLSMNALNYSREELDALGTNYQKAISYSVEEYQAIKAKILFLYASNNEPDVFSYFARLQPQGHDHYEWMYVSSKVIRDETNTKTDKRILISGQVEEMGDFAHKINRLLDENYYLKKNYKNYAALTKREREIIQLLCLGYNNPQISEKLFISRYTVEQHRKNINRKLEIKSPLELIKFAEVFDLID